MQNCTEISLILENTFSFLAWIWYRLKITHPRCTLYSIKFYLHLSIISSLVLPSSVFMIQSGAKKINSARLLIISTEEIDSPLD